MSDWLPINSVCCILLIFSWIDAWKVTVASAVAICDVEAADPLSCVSSLLNAFVGVKGSTFSNF